MAFKYCGLLLLGLAAVAKAQQGYPRDNPNERLTYATPNQRYSEEESDSTGDEIPGEAGKDYPIFGQVPETRFQCSEQQFPGYYADPEARCQVFHICQTGGRMDSFLCPNGTIFNQEKLVCDWWFNFDCGQAQTFYSINEAVFRAMEEADRNSAERNAAEGYRYNTPSGSRYQQHRPSSSSSSPSSSSPSSLSSANVPQSDFDTVVVEAARTAPISRLSKQSQSPIENGRQIFERQEIAAGHQMVGGPYAEEDNVRKNSQFTGATFGKQISASARDAEVFQDPAREYLPARNQFDNNNGY